jgi:hypothetical protein
MHYGLAERYPFLKLKISADPRAFFITVGVTTVVWIMTALLTRRTSQEQMSLFIAKIYPKGFDSFKARTPWLILTWVGGVIAVYSFLFASGKLIFHDYQEALIFGTSMIAGGFLCGWAAVKARLF